MKRKINFHIIVITLFVPLCLLAHFSYSWAYTNSSGDVEGYILKGRAYLVKGDEIQASRFFNKALAIDRRVKDRILDEYFKAGRILIKNPRKSNIGLHFLMRVYRAKPERRSDIAHVLHDGGLYLLDKNIFMAHMILHKALELDPEFTKDELFYFNLQVKSAYKPEMVIIGGKDFMRRFPSSKHTPEVLYLTGKAYEKLRNKKEARALFNRLKKEFPDSPWTKKLKEVKSSRAR